MGFVLGKVILFILQDIEFFASLAAPELFYNPLWLEKVC